MLYRNILKKLLPFRSYFSSNKIEAPKKYSQKISKARAMMPLYELGAGFQGQIFIAPNTTIVGEVWLGHNVSIGHGTVMRGDINSIELHTNISIGNNCVLHTAASSPTGIVAKILLEGDNVIQHNCTLYSCTLKFGAYVGYNSVILEGAIIEEGAIIAPNSVVPPGRVVKKFQVWGGNPIKYIKKTREQEAYVTRDLATTINKNMSRYKQEFLVYNNAYLYKECSAEDELGEVIHVPEEAKRNKADLYDPNTSTIN